MRAYKMPLITALIVAIVAFGATPAPAEEDRPRVAVVLGGGAARGFSHIGFLRALEEGGVPVDMLVGTSMGSIVAGLYASGLSVDNLEHLVTQVDFSELFTPVVPPKGGIVQTARFQRFIDALTNNAQVEQLPRSFYSVITNLVTGEEVALNEGGLGQAIVASMAIPGMFPPVQIGDGHYIDGGLLSPVPVHAARQLGADFIIAVDVRRTLSHIDHDDVLTNLQLALFSLLDKNTVEQIGDAHIVVAPGVEDNSYMEFDRAALFVEEGYRVTKEALPAIKAALLALDPRFPFGEQPPQKGFPPRDFENRVRAALRDEPVVPATTSFTFQPRARWQTGQKPAYNWQLGVPLTDGTSGVPIHALYEFTTGRFLKIGIDWGHCDAFCVSVYGRRHAGGFTWHPGVAATGKFNHLLHYKAEWDVVGTQPSQWHVAMKTPTPSGGSSSVWELAGWVGHDARGYEGAPMAAPGAESILRYFFIGEPTNHWEMLRGAAHLFVGVGAGVNFDAAARWYPLAELGVVYEARLFGLYPIRTRLSATYDGGDHSWTVRWGMGDGLF